MKKFCATIAFVALTLTTFAQTQVGDATLPNKITVESSELLLNGSGLREKLWFDLYACGLYLENKSNKASDIVTADKPMAINLEILSSLLSKKKLIGAFTDGVENTNSEAVVAEIAPDLKKFLGFVTNEIAVGDKYSISYTPETGTTLYINNVKKGAIKGLTFKKALFNIWLANDPVDDDLKEELLSL